MLFHSYCTAALAAMAAISPLAVVTAESSPSVRGAATTEDVDALVAGVTGRYLVQVTEYGDTSGLADEPFAGVDRRLSELQSKAGKSDPAAGPEMTAAFELPNGSIFNIEGLNLEDAARFSSGDAVVLPSGAFMSGETINVQGLPLLEALNAGNSPGPTLTGDKTVVGVRVITSCNDSTTSSAAELQQYIFDDAVNLAKQYKACSHGKLNIIKPPNKYSSDFNIASNIVGGIVTVKINRCVTDADDDGVMKNEITAAINWAFGVSTPTEIADHFMYCLPDNSFQGLAYAFKNDWMSVYNDVYCNYVSLQVHEVGHNLNFDHSNEGSEEYGDISGMMGYSYFEDDTPVMCFNAAKAWQSGWFADKSLTIDPNNDADPSFSGPLYGQDSYTSSPADAKVLIQFKSTTGQNHHIGFNGKQGSNSGTLEHGNRVLITTQAAFGQSWRIASLGAGQSCEITNYDGSGKDVVVSVTSISGSDHAVIDIALSTSNTQICDDNNACTTDMICDGECKHHTLPTCCGNGICEKEYGYPYEDFENCFKDCADGPFDLSTTMCSSSCYFQDGNMFEVKAKDWRLAITTLATRTYALRGATGTFGVEVWTKKGTMVGFENSMASWTKIADVEFTSAPWAMLKFPDFENPVIIEAGATQSFYVTHKNGGKALWTGGSATSAMNTLANEDASLQIFHGYYNVYPFGGKNLGTWNGVLTYVTDKSQYEYV